MLNNPPRIVIDTNLWISFLITNSYTKLNPLIFSGEVILIFSNELLFEFIRVAARPKFRKYFSTEDVVELSVIMEEHAEFIDVVSVITICRDVKDNFLLSLAVDSKADYLISGDNDLLELKEINSTKIIMMSDFFWLYL
jgi:putative PIN family toxin of toxin-antitoxin system